MALFPDDRRMADEIRDHLASHFDYAQRLLRYWVHADKDRGLVRSKCNRSRPGGIFSEN